MLNFSMKTSYRTAFYSELVSANINYEAELYLLLMKLENFQVVSTFGKVYQERITL